MFADIKIRFTYKLELIHYTGTWRYIFVILKINTLYLIIHMYRGVLLGIGYLFLLWKNLQRQVHVIHEYTLYTFISLLSPQNFHIISSYFMKSKQFRIDDNTINALIQSELTKAKWGFIGWVVHKLPIRYDLVTYV